jgi:hypothetical protein
MILAHPFCLFFLCHGRVYSGWFRYFVGPRHGAPVRVAGRPARPLPAGSKQRCAGPGSHILRITALAGWLWGVKETHHRENGCDNQQCDSEESQDVDCFQLLQLRIFFSRNTVRTVHGMSTVNLYFGLRCLK